jgi:hypothetical protein
MKFLDDEQWDSLLASLGELAKGVARPTSAQETEDSMCVVSVPEQGEFLVRNGKITKILEIDSQDGTDEYRSYAVYTEVDPDTGEEVTWP